MRGAAAPKRGRKASKVCRVGLEKVGGGEKETAIIPELKKGKGELNVQKYIFFKRE